MRVGRNEPLQRVTPAHPCPVCGHTGWCNFTTTMVHCMRVDAPVVGPWRFLKKAADGGNIYVLANDDARRDDAWSRPLPTRTQGSTTSELAPFHVRDRWYRQLLRHLSLSDAHLSNLRRRGLTDDMIRAQQYRTLPPFQAKDRSLLAKKLMDALGEEPTGIPGFFRSKKGLWLLGGAGGILIPVCDREGRIQGFQVRLDSPGKTWKVRTVPAPEMVAEGPYKGKTWWVAECQTEDGEVVQAVATSDGMAKVFQRLTPGDQLVAEFSRMADGRYTASKPLRYVWLSSAGRTGGCSPSTPLHVTAPVQV